MQTPEKMASSLMASVTQLFLFTALLLTSINANSLAPSTTACPPFTCAPRTAIRYPFWHQNQLSDHCGYPGFGLSCGGDRPVLRLSDDAYSIMKINYSENTLILGYADINNRSCPRPSHGVTLSNSSLLFGYSTRNDILRFFYNCSLYPPSLPSIDCLQYGTKRSYVFPAGAVPEFDWSGYCEATVTVPVMKNSIRGDLVHDFSIGIREGFELAWRPDGGCRSCEESRGFCGYGGGDVPRSFFCICSDARRSANCHDNGEVLVSYQLNLVGIGAVVFGGLMIAATMFYVIRRKKIGLYNPVVPVK